MMEVIAMVRGEVVALDGRVDVRDYKKRPLPCNTDIEYCQNADGSKGFAYNAITGCLRGCDGCWAQAYLNRFGGKGTPFPFGGEPSLHVHRIAQPFFRGNGLAYLVSFLGDAWASWIPPYWSLRIGQTMWAYRGNRFLCLTREPLGYKRVLVPFTAEQWPHVWFGTTVTQSSEVNRLTELQAAIPSNAWVSFEPLYDDIAVVLREDTRLLDGVKWAVIGGKTGADPFTPPLDWVKRLVDVLQERGIQIFGKDNLTRLPEYAEVLPKEIPYWER